jgi:hypothetical protein
MMGKETWSRRESLFEALLPLVGSAIALLVMLTTARVEFVAWRAAPVSGIIHLPLDSE